MNIAEHVSFDQLPSACKCLLSIVAMAANLKTGDKRPQSDEALASVARGFWDDSDLTPADLGNLRGVTEHLCIWLKSTRIAQN
jgi:hypothetical protein